jgi:hypothetical protein
MGTYMRSVSGAVADPAKNPNRKFWMIEEKGRSWIFQQPRLFTTIIRSSTLYVKRHAIQGASGAALGGHRFVASSSLLRGCRC